MKAAIKKTLRLVGADSLYRSLRVIEHYIKSLAYIGNKKYCNICKFHASRFLDGGVKAEIFSKEVILGGGYRTDVMCPFCHTFERHRLLFYYLTNQTEVLNGTFRILYFAPEYQIYQELRKNPRGDIITGDIVRGRAEYVIDITEIQFLNDTFDLILCNHVLEHISDEGKAISELCRVCKPTGQIILTFPLCLTLEKTFEDPSVVTEEARLQVFGQKDHVRLYGLDAQQHLEGFGLKVDSYIWRDHVDEKRGNYKLGIDPEDRIFICRKS